MEELNIIIEPELEFSLKKCGDVVPYGITPEEREKLAGIEENANKYTHPDTHPSSILDVVDVVNGAANKFLNERGEMVAVATSSIGVTGSPLYASTANSDVAGYKSLVGTPQALETEITLTAKSTNGIVWGDKYLSAPFTEAVTIPATAYGFDYWRKVSAANGTSRKHLRVFVYRAGEETNISTPLTSPEIDETEFTERQISYIFPELVLLVGDRIGIQEGFSATHANNITLTYIVGDGRGWFMRLPLPLKHESLTDKNKEAAFQHVDTTITKPALDAADMVAIKDSVTGKMVLTPKSNFVDSIQLASYTYNGNLEVHLTSIDVATSTFVKNSHGFLNNNNIFPVINIGNIELFLKDVCFGGLELVNYYVVNSTQNTFQLSKTLGGLPITLVSNPTLDLSKWHFEKGTTSAITISGLSNEKKIYADFEGRSLGAYKSIYIYPNGVTPIALEWLFANNTAGATVALTNGRIIFGSMGDVFSKFRCLIDYSSFLTESVNGYVIQSSLTNQRFTSTLLDLEIMSPKYKNGEITTLTFNFTSGSYIANGSTIKLYRA